MDDESAQQVSIWYWIAAFVGLMVL